LLRRSEAVILSCGLEEVFVLCTITCSSLVIHWPCACGAHSIAGPVRLAAVPTNALGPTNQPRPLRRAKVEAVLSLGAALAPKGCAENLFAFASTQPLYGVIRPLIHASPCKIRRHHVPGPLGRDHLRQAAHFHIIQPHMKRHDNRPVLCSLVSA